MSSSSTDKAMFGRLGNICHRIKDFKVLKCCINIIMELKYQDFSKLWRLSVNKVDAMKFNGVISDDGGKKLKLE